MSESTKLSAESTTSPVADLTLGHYEQHIVGSDIADHIAKRRGYRTVTTADEAEKLGFSPEQAAHVPALVIPLYDVHGERRGCQLRPDTPRLKEGGGENKYEHAPGARNVLDCHPSNLPWVGDPAIPLLITEGSKKADAAVSSIRGATHKVLPLSISGVGNWRGRTERGGKSVPLPDWRWIPFRNKKDTPRTVYVCFDSDVMVKPAVHAELAALGAFLRDQGGDVRYIYLPPGPDGEKVGLDDFLKAGHTLQDVFNLAEPTLRPLDTQRPWLTFAELLTLPPLPWLIKELLPAEGVAVVYGNRGAYKSLIVLDWLASVVGDSADWFGLPVMKHGPAVYVYAEGRAGLGQRVQAVKLARYLTDETPLIAWPTAIDIADPKSAERLIAQVEAALPDRTPVVIVIDTLARNMPGRDENKQMDMNAFIAGCDQIRAAFQCLVIIVHHTNRAGTIRGSTVLDGAVDTALEVEWQAKCETKLTVAKQKDAEPGPPRTVRLRPEAQSLVVAEVTAATGIAAKAKDVFTDGQRDVFQVLAEHLGPLGFGEWTELAEKDIGASESLVRQTRSLASKKNLISQTPDRRWQLTPLGREYAGARGWSQIA